MFRSFDRSEAVSVIFTRSIKRRREGVRGGIKYNVCDRVVAQQVVATETSFRANSQLVPQRAKARDSIVSIAANFARRRHDRV